MRKELVAMLLLLSAIGAGVWWSQAPHRPTAVTQRFHVKSRPGVSAEESASKRSQLDGSGPTGGPGPAGRPRDVSWPEIERNLIKGDAVEADVSQRTITADAGYFGRAMDSLETTMLADPLASEFGASYKELLLDRIRSSEERAGLNLTRIACSTQVCFAQMSGTEAATEAFRRSLTKASVKEFPSNTRSLYVYSDPKSGSLDLRVMFTTNPKINSFHVRPPKPTKL